MDIFSSVPCSGTYYCSLFRDSPAYAVKFEPDTDLLSILSATQKPIRSPYKLFYQVLGIPITELEHKKQFKLLYYNNSGTEIQSNDQQGKMMPLESSLYMCGSGITVVLFGLKI